MKFKITILTSDGVSPTYEFDSLEQAQGWLKANVLAYEEFTMTIYFNKGK